MIGYTTLKYIELSYLIAGLVVLRDSAMAQWTELSPHYEECHDDLGSNPGDFTDVRMRFPWLAFLQYVRIKDGMLYHGRVPRVVMVHRQYVLATAADVTDVPQGYSLGNVVFKNYDRDEDECGITTDSARAGVECHPAELVMPIVDVILHPEYLDEANRPPDSIAVVKMMQRIQSNYMVPICFPFFDFVKEKKKYATTFVIDFENKIPQVLNEETKYSQKLQILPTQLCNRLQKFRNVSESHWPLALCTSGCGMSRGAPLVSHLPNGWWVLVALTSQPILCTDPNVWRSSSAEPNRFVSVLPYVDWITNTTAGRVDPKYTLKDAADDPFGYRLLNTEAYLDGVWSGRVYRAGPACFNKNVVLFHYYKDIFKIKSDYNGLVNYFLNLQPDPFYKVECVKLDMPNRLIVPLVYGVEHWNVSIVVNGAGYVKLYEIAVAIGATAASDKEKLQWMQDKTDKQKQQTN